MTDLSSTGPRIPQLPNELLLQIFEGISNTYDEQCLDFSTLARVCHHFFGLITPLLYRSFEHCCDKHLQLFAQTIFAKKDRAALVQHFKGRTDRSSFEPGFASCLDWDDDDWDQPYHAPLKAEARRTTSRSSQKGPWGQFIAFALASVCPNMQWLDLTDCTSDLFARLGDVMAGKTLKPETAFQRVSTLSLSMDSVTRSFHMHDISLLFRMESLRSLTFKHAALSGLEKEFWSTHMELEYFWKCDWESSPIEKITLEECCLPLEWIIAIIISCKALKHFHLEYYHRFVGHNLYTGLFKELANHQHSLLSLQINELDGCKTFSLGQTEPDEPISFRHYKSLTLLDIPLFLLSTKKHRRSLQSIFPSTLQVLALGVKSSREGFSDAFFINLAESSKLEMPSIRSVRVVCQIENYNRNGYFPLHFCHLHRMFSSHGVGFTYALEFISCEFRIAYMESLLKTLRNSGPDGSNIADHSSFEEGCQTSCRSRSTDAAQSKEHWGYMQPWTGPTEFIGKICAERSVVGFDSTGQSSCKAETIHITIPVPQME